MLNVSSKRSLDVTLLSLMFEAEARETLVKNELLFSR